MEKTLKAILWTIVTFTIIVMVTKLFFWSLPFLLVGFLFIYLYGKYKIRKFVKEAENYTTSYSYNAEKVTKDDSEEVEIVDVEYKDAE